MNLLDSTLAAPRPDGLQKILERDFCEICEQYSDHLDEVDGHLLCPDCENHRLPEDDWRVDR